MQETKHKICIIGAGPCGLVAARHLSQPPNFEVTVFEANSQVGGLWVYDDRNEADPQHHDGKSKDPYYQFNNHFHASVYPHLQTNIPYPLMGYKDLSHDDVEKGIPSFVKHSQHKKYLDAYAEKFGLRKYIQLNTLVRSVRLSKNLSPEEQFQARKFTVEAMRTTSTGHTYITCHTFDYVVIATGHNSKPYVPEIKGIENFKGKIMNSKCFREPSTDYLKGKKIVVVGSGFSAIDIATQLLENPYIGPQDIEKVTIIGRKIGFLEESQDYSRYISSGKLCLVQGEIESVIDEKSIRFSDGTVHEADTLIFSTGYMFKFPFLDLEKDKFVDFDPKAFRGKFMGPIYKRFVCIREPDLFFIGLIDDSSLADLCFELHILIIRYLIEGKLKLPSKDKMVQSFLKDIDDLRFVYQKPLDNFKLARETMDISYWREMKEWVNGAHRGDVEKGKRFEEMTLNVYRKMVEIASSGNYLSYKKYDFSGMFIDDLKNSIEFI